MTLKQPYEGLMDADGNVIQCIESLLRHAALLNEENAECGVPQMPLSIDEIAPGRFCLIFGSVGLQDRTHWEAWKTLNSLALAWCVGYLMGRQNR